MLQFRQHNLPSPRERQTLRLEVIEMASDSSEETGLVANAVDRAHGLGAILVSAS